MHLHCDTSLFFFFYLALYSSPGIRSRSSLLSLCFLYLCFSTPSGLTFRRRIALSSVVFIVCGVDDEDATRWDEVLLRRTAIRPGRLAARFRVNVLLVISGLATSSTFSPPSFLDLLPENRLSPCRPCRCRPSSSIRSRSASRHRPCKLESSRGSAFVANYPRARRGDRSNPRSGAIRFRNSRSDLKIKASSWILEGIFEGSSHFERDQSRNKVSLCPRRECVSITRDFEMFFPFVYRKVRPAKRQPDSCFFSCIFLSFFFFIFRSVGRKYLATYEMSRRKRRRGVPINSGPVL